MSEIRVASYIGYSILPTCMEMVNDNWIELYGQNYTTTPILK